MFVSIIFAATVGSLVVICIFSVLTCKVIRGGIEEADGKIIKSVVTLNLTTILTIFIGRLLPIFIIFSDNLISELVMFTWFEVNYPLALIYVLLIHNKLNRALRKNITYCKPKEIEPN